MGGKENIKHKLKSFSHTEFSGEEFCNDSHLDACLNEGVNIFKKDEKSECKIVELKNEYPDYVLQHILEYPELVKKPKQLVFDF